MHIRSIQALSYFCVFISKHFASSGWSLAFRNQGLLIRLDADTVIDR
jgi:hypothetical protein